MREFVSSSVYLAVCIVLVSYFIASFIHKKTGFPLFSPLILATIFSIAIMYVLPIEYEEFADGAQPLVALLTPATICLAVPLYEQYGILKQNKTALIVGVASGVLTALGSLLVLCLICRIPHNIYVSMLSKSITTAVAIGLTEELGGVVPITVASITITGLFGNVIAVSFLRLLHIEEPIAKGVAIGTSSHVAGTAKAMEIGPLEGAVSSLSLIVSALLTVIGANIFATFL